MAEGSAGRRVYSTRTPEKEALLVRTRMVFQYLAPGSTMPDDITIAEIFTELQPRDHVPAIGDIVTILPKLPSEGLTDFQRLKVVARNFWYAYGGPELGELVDCQIYVILSEPGPDDVIDVAQ